VEIGRSEAGWFAFGVLKTVHRAGLSSGDREGIFSWG
jgi:hypothetical protein